MLSRYVDAIMIRTFAHQDVVDLAAHGAVPVINGLTDRYHPCQALADCFTIREHCGDLDGLKLVYVGDGNNVAHELMFGAAEAGDARSASAAPPGYEPNPLIYKSAVREAQKLGASLPEVTADPRRRWRGRTSSTPTSGPRWARRRRRRSASPRFRATR